MHPAGGLLRTPPPLPPPPLPPSPFHHLEVTVVSAQDLHPAVRSSMRTYAVAWLSTGPGDKHHTPTSSGDGHTDPTWNHKFLIRLDDATLDSDTAALNFDIYAARSKLRPGPDTLLGTARALLSTVRPSLAHRFVALQVRRPSLRPQGILNVGFALVDEYAMRLPRDIDGGRRKKEEEKAKVRLERSKSAEEMEKKLEMWRVELPRTVKDEERERNFARGKSRRTKSRLVWFGTDGDGEGDGGGGGGGGGDGGGLRPERG